MVHSILVPLDGSPFGEQSLPLALAIARRAGATLELVHVHVPFATLYGETMPGFEVSLEPTLKQRGHHYLETLVKRLGSIGDISLTSTLLEGEVREVLFERAKATKADLIVMATHGRGPLARTWLGSVADDLVRRMPMPVLLIHPRETAVDLSQEAVFQHVLIPLDGSSLAEQIIEPAVALGNLVAADYTLLRAIQPMVLGNFDPGYMSMSGLGQEVLKDLQSLHEEDRTKAQAYLDRIAAGLRGRGLKVQTRIAVNDQPGAAILDKVKTHKADLVALETHGRSGLPRLFLGSVADKVIRGASIPVLVHRPVHEIA